MSDNSRVRVSIVGVVIVALFSALVARLWFLQMGPERSVKGEVISLTTRQLQTQSPRGSILDRNGVVLAQDRAAWAVTIDRKLTHKTQTLDRLFGQLSETLCQGSPAPCKDTAKNLKSRFNSVRQSPLLPAVVALDVSLDHRLAILQHRDDYPGVAISQLTVRDYPAAKKYADPELAAQVLGYVGEIDSAQLKKLKAKGYQAGDAVGRDGIESAYESALHGRPEIDSIQVDPTGAQIGPATVVQPGTAGNNVYLTIDSRIQVAAERALGYGIKHARTLTDDSDPAHPKPYVAPAGAVVVLDTQDGSIVASASNPSFPPQNWVGGISETDNAMLQDPRSNAPMVNRVTQGQYLPGSTYKLVTGTALTKYGIRGPFEPYEDTGSITVGADNRVFRNDNGAVNHSVDLARALTVSSDTYFYTAGDAFWNIWNAGDKARGLGMQEVAHDFGLGAKTGIEVDESPGRVPDPTWKAAFSKAINKDPAAQLENAQWRPGDEVQLAVGQQDVLVTPLQLAEAYAMFATNGTEWAPHLGFQVKDAKGKVVKTIGKKVLRTMQFDPTARGQMMAGFRGAVNDPSGTAFAAFQGFTGGTVAGKTGTAQVTGKQATSLFAGMFPAENPRYVVVALVEQAGHGADVAAPIVRQVLEALVNPTAPPPPDPNVLFPTIAGKD